MFLTLHIQGAEVTSSINPNLTKKASTMNRPPTKKIRMTSGVRPNDTESKKTKGKSRENAIHTDTIKTVSRTSSHHSAMTKPANDSKLKQQSIIAALGNLTVFVWDEFALGE